jgi:predicted nucleic acid-binding protein
VAAVIVLDASVLIAYLDSEDAHHARAEALLVREVDDSFAASVVTLADVLVMPARERRLDAACEAMADLEVEELALPGDSAIRLAQLRADTSLKMPDCCVLLAAQDARASVASFDDRLNDAAKRRSLVVVRS